MKNDSVKNGPKTWAYPRRQHLCFIAAIGSGCRYCRCYRLSLWQRIARHSDKKAETNACKL